MKNDNLYFLLSETISGERAKEDIKKITLFHRIQASDGFLNAAKYIQKELINTESKRSNIISYKSGGKIRYYEWPSPYSWTIRSGKLKMIHPSEKELCDYSKVPLSIATHSKSCNITTSVVHIGKGTDEEIEGLNLKNKIVLTSGKPSDLIEKLYEKGACGYIFYPEEERSKEYPNMRQYIGLWPTSENIDKSTFGFSISRKQALELINYLKNEKELVVHAKIEASLSEGQLHVLSDKIEGSLYPDEEVILIAHLCHPLPSANDNASGSAVLLEIFRAIKGLIQQEKIPRPERTIRFLWVPEFHGTLPWIAEHEKKPNFKPICCINLDMVGEHPAIIGYPLTLWKQSVSTPSLLGELIEEIMKQAMGDMQIMEEQGWQFPGNYRIAPFAGGSDHILFTEEPFRIPSVMLGHEDQFRHTTYDTLDKVDSTRLKQTGLIAGLTALVFAYKSDFLDKMLSIYIKATHKKRGQVFGMIIDELNKIERLQEKKKAIQTVILAHIIEKYAEMERVITDQLLNYPHIPQQEELILTIADEITAFKQRGYQLIELLGVKVSNKDSLPEEFDYVPIRNWKGPINYKKVFSILNPKTEDNCEIKEEKLKVKKYLEKQESSYSGLLFELLNLINNKRSILDILALLSLYDMHTYDYEVILDFYKICAAESLILLKTKTI
ncbi:MAG: DUF4910 domain-containing protein [Candidatus Heimdallarchaeaceae archaeon]